MLTPPLAEQGYYGESLERPEARGIYHDAAAEKAVFGPNGLTFDSFLDIINPLHHIPVVNSIYTELTGDTIAPGPSVIGGLLFGGAIGVVGSVANAAFEAITGDTVGGHAMAAFGDDKPEDGQVAVGEVKLAGSGATVGGAAADPAMPAAATQTPPATPAVNALAIPNPAGEPVSRAPQAGSLTAANMFRAKTATPAGNGEAASQPPIATAAAAAAPPAATMAAAEAPRGLDRLANGTPSDMPQLSADLDARLRHAQQAMIASGLVAAPDAAVQARLGQALNQAGAADGPPGGRVPPPPSAQGAAAAPVQAMQAPMQQQPVQQQQIQQPAALQTQSPEGQAIQAQQQAVASQQPVRSGSRTYMPLDTDSRGGRRWFGLGTAELASGVTPASPQMAAQALASQVYRQQGAATQGAAAALDVTY